VLVHGAKAPHVISREQLQLMKPGTVLVDVAIDQGGCFETSRVTSHTAPTYVDGGVVHYCVANMPAAVARTSTLALTQATLPFLLRLAGLGWRRALQEDPHLRAGLNVCAGEVTCRAVGEALGVGWRDPDTALRAAA
jgi:alanine dehydrogenase